MNEIDHAHHLVDLVDEQGHPVAVKKRIEIDKQTDLYHAIFIHLVTPDQNFILAQISVDKKLPNIYAGRLGFPMATIRRHNESIQDAAKRCLTIECQLSDAAPIHMVTKYFQTSDGHRSYASLFTIKIPVDIGTINKARQDLLAFSRSECQLHIEQCPHTLTPHFIEFWPHIS